VAKKADFLVAGTTFNREAHLKAHGSRGLLLGEVLPSNDVCLGGAVGG
jgi:hypothetical protein